MFDWFRKKKADASAPDPAPAGEPEAIVPKAPHRGPDFSAVDTREKAQALVETGVLDAMALVPAEFGGEASERNTVFVPRFVVEAKQRIDSGIVARLAQEGRVTRYGAELRYLDRSVVPSAITVEASHPERPGSFSATVHVWGPAGSAATDPAQPEIAPHAPPPSDTLPPDSPDDGATPENRVRAFVRDYRHWNARAASTIGDDERALSEQWDHEYDAMLARHRVAGLPRQGLAYGSDPTHDPARTRIVAVAAHDDQAIVRTQIPMHPMLSGVHTHEFELVRRDGRWWLTEVWYLDGDERLPCL